MCMAILFRQKNRCICFLLLFMCCAFFTACDPVAQKKPVVFPYSRWVCEELNTWFIVDPALSVVYYGQMEQNGVIQELGFYCDAGPYGCINTFDSVSDGILYSKEAAENLLWRGAVEYEEDKFVLTQSSRNDLFQEDAFPIEFIREDLTEEEIREISPWDEDGNLKETRGTS